MAFQLIHTFTALSGITYYIQVDWDADEILTTWSPPDSSPLDLTVTAGELGFNSGDTIAQICRDTTLKKALASLNFPFATLQSTPNSPICGWTAPVCTYVAVASSTNATNNGNNGSITINLTNQGGLPYRAFEFSLDNINWQNSPIFNFLFPGIYQVYIRTTTGCLTTLLVTVGNTTVTTVIPADIPWQQTNLLCYFFRLIIDGVTHAIREPIKWDDVQIIGERDQDYHGYLFRHTDGNVDLGFDCDAGKELIEAVYNEKGQDGDIQFVYGFTYGGIDYILFDGNLMLNTYKWYPEKIECTVETKDIDTAFQSRMDTPVSMAQDKTFDNADVQPPAAYSLSLHPKEIFTRFYSDRNNVLVSTNNYTQGTRHIYVKPDNTSPTYSDLRENFQYPLGPQTLNPDEVQEYYVKFFVGGKATYSMSFNFLVDMRRSNTGDDPDTTARMYIVKKKWDAAQGIMVTTKLDIATPFVGQFNGNGYLTFSIAGSYSSTDEVFSAGDELFIYLDIFFDRENQVLFQQLLQITGSLHIDYNEMSLATPANVWFLEDVIRHCINVAGNNHYAFRSSFLERLNANQVLDGCGSKYVVSNGYQIRQFDIDNRPLKVSLKNALAAVRGIFCIGMHYANNDAGAFLRIERADYFYQERQIITIEEPESYKEEVAIEQVYNELEMGYEKYQADGYNSLDEFNTKMQLLTPIRKNKKKLSVLSPFITSGYRIEDVRRNQFSETPSSSVENDEDAFLIAVKRENAADWSTEKNEAFQTVTGIISPATAYNLRISPKRILYNWFIWLKGIFAYKENTDVIRPTQLIQNNDLITRFNTSETCRVGDADRATIEEKADVPMTALASTRDIWRPEKVTIKCRLNPAQVQMLNLAMTGRWGTDKDFGYIMIKKPDGDWQAVWLDKISYNYWTEKAEITGKKKHSTPAVQTGDCCPWLIANGCYIKANGNKLIA